MMSVGGGRGRGGTLRDDDHCSSNEMIAHAVAGLHVVKNGAGGVVSRFHLLDGFVKRRIKRLAHSGNALDAHLFQGIEELLQHDAEPISDGLGIARTVRMRERPLEIVEHGQQILHCRFFSTLLRIIDLATTPHRENLRPKKVEVDTASFKLDGLGPTAMTDRAGNQVPALGAMGRF